MNKPGLCSKDMQTYTAEESGWGAGEQMTKGQIRRSLDCNKEVVIFDALVKKAFTALLALGHKPISDT